MFDQQLPVDFTAAGAACLGSRSIVIDGGSQVQRLAIVYLHDDSYIRLVVAGETSSYQGQLAPSDTKLNFDDHDRHSQLQLLGSYILDHHDGISATYRPQDAENLVVTLRQTLDSGIVKILWTGTLTNVSNVLSLIGSTLNQQRRQLDQAASENVRLAQDVQVWKGQVDSILHKQQLEKDILTHQFSKLYEATHDKMREMRKNLDRLQRQEEVLYRPASNISSKKRVTKDTSTEDFTEGQPNDHDAVWDSSLVRRMTESIKSRPEAETTSPAIDTSSKVVPIAKTTSSTDAPAQKSSLVTKRRAPPKPVAKKRKALNPALSVPENDSHRSSPTRTNNNVRTAKEVFSTDDLFRDPAVSHSLSQSEPKKLKKARDEQKDQLQEEKQGPPRAPKQATEQKKIVGLADLLADSSSDDDVRL
jgi:uncharacterized protein YoxC